MKTKWPELFDCIMDDDIEGLKKALLYNSVYIEAETLLGTLTPFMLAVVETGEKSIEALKLLLKEANYVNHPMIMNAFLAAIEYKDLEKMKVFLKAGIDVNEKDEKGNTPLLISVQEGAIQITKELIDAGADVLAKNDDGVDAFNQAMKNGDIETAHLIQEAVKKTLKKQKINPCQSTASFDKQELIESGVGWLPNNEDEVDDFSQSMKNEDINTDYLNQEEEQKSCRKIRSWQPKASIDKNPLFLDADTQNQFSRVGLSERFR